MRHTRVVHHLGWHVHHEMVHELRGRATLALCTILARMQLLRAALNRSAVRLGLGLGLGFG